MGLFHLVDVKLHSGRTSKFKVECDALSSADVECAAYALSRLVGPFLCVVGVPRGGVRLAEAMGQYADSGAEQRLIVDDVLTTGGSMTELRDRLAKEADVPYYLFSGAVVFARSKCPEWVRAWWQAPKEVWDA